MDLHGYKYSFEELMLNLIKIKIQKEDSLKISYLYTIMMN